MTTIVKFSVGVRGQVARSSASMDAGNGKATLVDSQPVHSVLSWRVDIDLGAESISTSTGKPT